MTGVLIRRKNKHRTLCDNQLRVWNDASTSQERPRIRMTLPTLWLWTCSLQNCERTHSYCFKSSPQGNPREPIHSSISHLFPKPPFSVSAQRQKARHTGPCLSGHQHFLWGEGRAGIPFQLPPEANWQGSVCFLLTASQFCRLSFRLVFLKVYSVPS